MEMRTQQWTETKYCNNKKGINEEYIRKIEEIYRAVRDSMHPRQLKENLDCLFYRYFITYTDSCKEKYYVYDIGNKYRIADI
jgi:hypothetical protein